MDVVADLHIHGRYSAATSPKLSVPTLAGWAKKKGISLLGTADFTHPLWMKELKQYLHNTDDETHGIYTCKDVNFLLSVEVSNVFEQEGKAYKIHTVLLAPSFEVAEQIREELAKGGNLAEDGRPTLSFSIEEMVETLMQIDKRIGIIPAHIWTPWFSLFGSKFGADSVEEVYGSYSNYILALETGLSSDPAMNWRVKALERFPLVSFSDAHSPANLAREATHLRLDELSYADVYRAIKGGKGILKTYEYFPQEGKYFYDGHRKCNVCLSPEESLALKNICPVCHKPLTLGVLHRIYELSAEYEGKSKGSSEGKEGKKEEKKDSQDMEGWSEEKKKPFIHIIPLRQLISYVLKKGANTKAVNGVYDRLIRYFGSELSAYESSDEHIQLLGNVEVAKAILAVKKGAVVWKPGCDGQFGTFSIKEKGEEDKKGAGEAKQRTLF